MVGLFGILTTMPCHQEVRVVYYIITEDHNQWQYCSYILCKYLRMGETFARLLLLPLVVGVDIVSEKAGVASPRTTSADNRAAFTPCSVVRRPVILVKLKQLRPHQSSRVFTRRRHYQIEHLTTRNHEHSYKRFFGGVKENSEEQTSGIMYITTLQKCKNSHVKNTRGIARYHTNFNTNTKTCSATMIKKFMSFLRQ